MASIIEGYNYGIFISYLQNDNKYDGWVTEFVENMNKELEATIKDKVSAYFDAIPNTLQNEQTDSLICLLPLLQPVCHHNSKEIS